MYTQIWFMVNSNVKFDIAISKAINAKQKNVGRKAR